MAEGIRTIDELDQLVTEYFEFDEFVFDVETMAPPSIDARDPHRNTVFWISLAGPDRADVIPCGHPVGERIEYPEGDTQRRINPSNRHHQERRINPDTGREKWFDVPEPFTEPPKQLWISDVAEILRPLFFSTRIRKVGQNVKFDLLSMTKYFGATPPPPYGDTMVAAKLINENHNRYRLEDMVQREFKFGYSKIGKVGVERFPFSEAHLYSFLDARYTWLLWQKYKKLLKTEKVEHVFDFEMQLLPAIMDMEKAGITIDKVALVNLGKEFALKLEKLQVAINRAAGKEINLNANRQISELVYDTLGHRCMSYTKKGMLLLEQGAPMEVLKNYRATDRDSLERYQKDPVVKNILEHAQYQKLQSTFVTGISEKLHETNKIHPSFNQMGANTGRMSCSQPNVQQIPSRSEQGKRIREIFVPSKGNVFVVSDLSQIELRVLAHFTRDPELIKVYQQGISLHKQNAALAFGPDYTPEQYSYAKNAGFSAVYGAVAKTMARKYKIPLPIAEQILDSFYAKYRRVKPWKQEIWDLARTRYKRGVQPPYVETILGRKRRLPELMFLDRQVRSGAERQAISVTIQGTAADLFKLIMINIHDTLLQQSWEGHLLMNVHDEVVVEVPERHAEEGLHLVKTLMENVENPYTGAPILTVPLEAEAKILNKWSEMK